MWEILLGRPLLITVGIDVEDQLLQVAAAQKAAAAEEDADAIDWKSDADDNAAALNSLVDSAVEDGLPIDRRDQLASLVLKYKDIVI